MATRLVDKLAALTPERRAMVEAEKRRLLAEEAQYHLVEEQITREEFASASEFVRSSPRDAQRRQAKQELEAKLREGLQDESTVMTPDDWRAIERDTLEGLDDGTDQT